MWISKMRISYKLVVGACGVLLLGACSKQILAAEAPFKVKEHYTKSEIMIPMRDGVKLFTIVYAPRDHSQKYPFLISRTAYGVPPYGPENYRNVIGPNNDFAKEGYIVEI